MITRYRWGTLVVDLRGRKTTVLYPIISLTFYVGLEMVIPSIGVLNPLRLQNIRKRWNHVLNENNLYFHKVCIYSYALRSGVSVTKYHLDLLEITVVEDRYPQLRKKTPPPVIPDSTPPRPQGIWDKLKDFFA
jgi:hypothetical protein